MYTAYVAEAVTWSEKNPDQQGDEAVEAVQDKNWDPSVMSLVAFPQVLSMAGEHYRRYWPFTMHRWSAVQAIAVFDPGPGWAPEQEANGP